MHLAHVDRDSGRKEPLEDHLLLVAKGNDSFVGAAGFAAGFGARECGKVLGLW